MTFTVKDYVELEQIEPFESVFAFMLAGGQVTDSGPAEGFGTDVDSPMRKLRRKMLTDPDHGEVFEYLRAEFDNNLIETLDGLADTIYVAIGTLIKYCKDNPYMAAAILKEVCVSNMTKVVEGELITDDEGKILKPASYVPPRIAELVKLFELDK